MNLEKISSWKIKFGYVTGNPKHGNDGWFICKSHILNKTLPVALYEARKEGYKKSEDICADFVFSVMENGSLVSDVIVCLAMAEANQILIDEVEG